MDKYEQKETMRKNYNALNRYLNNHQIESKKRQEQVTSISSKRRSIIKLLKFFLGLYCQFGYFWKKVNLSWKYYT